MAACGLSPVAARRLLLLLHSTWTLSESGIEPAFSALAGGFLTTRPPRKSGGEIVKRKVF